MNIINQLFKALEILKDYPGIDEVLKIQEAKKFLLKLSEVQILTNIDRFPEIGDEIIEKIKNNLGTFSKWEEKLETTLFCKLIPPGNDNDWIFLVSIPPTLKEVVSNSTEGNVYVIFYADGTADCDDLEIEGTWIEVYEKIINHIEKITTIPELPENSSK